MIIQSVAASIKLCFSQIYSCAAPQGQTEHPMYPHLYSADHGLTMNDLDIYMSNVVMFAAAEVHKKNKKNKVDGWLPQIGERSHFLHSTLVYLLLLCLCPSTLDMTFIYSCRGR